MSRYFLRKHVYYCELDDGLVFLDLKRERYVGLGGHDAKLFRSLVPQPSLISPVCLEASTTETATLADSLVRTGLLTQEPTLGKPFIAPTVECTASIERPAEQEPILIRPAHVLRFFLACLRARAYLRFLPLESAITRAARLKRTSAASAQPSIEDVRKLVCLFRRLRPVALTSKDACLLESLALLEFLACFAVFPTWVFGVHLRPFGAHSWLQYGTLVLNGTVDQARLFTPILAI